MDATRGEGQARREALWVGVAAMAFAALGLAFAGGWIQPTPTPSRPSVLLVSIDTLRADHVGAYGAEDATTPVLDGLAEAGWLFEQAFAPVPLTLPSHTTLLTGLEPTRHGVRHNGLYRLGETETLATRLAAAGYRTGAFVGSLVLAAETGLSQGFETYDDRMSRQAFAAGVFLERSAEEVTNAALHWLADQRGPVFAFVHFYDPHLEYRAPERIAERFPDRPYDAEIHYADEQLGRLVEAFRRRSGEPEPLIVVTSDHGESFGAHGEATHGYTLHDGVLRVPLVFAGAGLPRGERSRALAGLIDVAPTIVARLGLAPLGDVDGRDLVTAHADVNAPRERSIYAETLATELDHGWAPLHSLRSPEYRYVRAPRPELYAAATGQHPETNLFDMPGDRDPEALATARSAHERGLDAVLARAVAGERQTLDATTRGALEALGYAVTTQPVAETGLDPKDGMRFLARYAEASEAFAAKRYDEAERALREVLEGSPSSASAHSLLSRIRIMRGDPERAAHHARRAHELLPTSATYAALLGMLELQLGDPDAAAQRFEAASALDPNVAELQVGLMWRAAREGRLAEAEAHRARATALGAGRWEIQQWIGTLWTSLGRLDAAETAFLEATSLAPGEPQPHADLALLWIRRGDARAQRALDRIGPLAGDPSFRNRLAIAHASAGDPDRAIAIFETLVAERPDYAPARNNLASLRKALALRGPS